MAQRLSWVPATMGALIVLIWLAERLTVLLNTSLTTTITLTGIVSTLIMATMATALAIGTSCAARPGNRKTPPFRPGCRR
ncbi:hypothetical protein WJ968_16130 [Achromobacter xylosoxidans]